MRLRWSACALLCALAEEFREAVEEDALSVSRLASLFGQLDGDGDGQASPLELLRAAEAARLGLATKDVEVALEEMDRNRDGWVTFEELHEGEVEPIDDDDRRDMEKRRTEDLQLFKAADVDADGRLTPAELRAVLYPETQQELLRLVAEHALKRKDLDGDGQLTLSEFWEGDVAPNEEPQEEGATFRRLDRDQNGHLNVEELMDWESGAHHTQVAFEELLRMCDDNGDGQLSLEELTGHHQQLSNTDAAYHFLEWAEHYEL